MGGIISRLAIESVTNTKIGLYLIPKISNESND